MTVGRPDRLLDRTRRRLFAVTLGLLALLVVGIGAATAVVGLRALDANVDAALHAAVDAQVAALDGELPSAEESQEPDDQAPFGQGDTVLLVLDTGGQVIQNRTGQSVAGLPDAEAVAAAQSSAEDLRTIPSGDTTVRVLTVPFRSDGAISGYVQGGYLLTLHEEQSRSLVLAVLVVGVVGLLAAALITLLLTDRALVPIREGFEAQRRFVADASHELRTPAALIRANAEVLEREGLVAADGRDLLGDIIAEADRLGGLVGDLLQLAAWDETALTVAPVPTDVAVVVADTLRGATALAAERDVRLEVATPPAGAWALADRSRLVQLLLILLDNAVDHSPAGGTVHVRVLAGSAPAGPDAPVTIEVDDEGPGIPASERERIFAPFTRLAGTTRHGSGGTGLGLAIARRITDAHGGTIEAASPEGIGARFTVTLPGAKAPARDERRTPGA
ncbi:MAG TPA: HAMP domain-containing sensor histidine kinase [Candidatus Limnocylindrales bacterium]|nr:HAMP domain-containing sensor histidine kinase [Candidatus Limnocylindrales bacterium]